MTKYAGLVNLYNCLTGLPVFEETDPIREKMREFRQYAIYIEDEKLEQNDLYLQVLKTHFSDLYSMVFNCDNQLKNLLELYIEIYPREANHILQYLSTYTFDIKNPKNILLKGDIQSGKTAMMILTSMLYLIHDRDVVLILRNKNDDKLQFKQRFYEFVEKLKDRNYSHPNFNIIDKKEKPKTKACLFVDIYSEKNVNRILNEIKKRTPEQAILYIDEADVRDDMKDKEFLKLYDTIGTKLFVSATVQDILVSKWNITGGTIIPLFQSELYRGIEHLEFIPYESFESAFSLIEQDHVPSETHPKIALIHIERYLDKMYKIFDAMKQGQLYIDENHSMPITTQNLCTIEYTGKGIRIHHPSLEQSELEEAEFQVKRFTDHTALIVKSSIKNVLLWLKRHGGKERFPNIVMIAGDLASRGINFACFDELDETSWHITHQILVKSNSSNASNVIQALRILGNHGDELPLKLYTTDAIRETILKSNRLANELTRCMIDSTHPFHKSEFSNTPTNEICKALPIHRDTIPKKFLKSKKISEALRVVQTSEPAILDREEEEEEKKEEDVLTEEEVKEMETRFVKWYYDNTDYKISQFMRDIEPTRAYTKNEILDIFTKYNMNHGNWGNLFQFVRGNTNGYGKILRENKNKTYQLYPQLVEIYQQIFNNQ